MFDGILGITNKVRAPGFTSTPTFKHSIRSIFYGRCGAVLTNHDQITSSYVSLVHVFVTLKQQLSLLTAFFADAIWIIRR